MQRRPYKWEAKVPTHFRSGERKFQGTKVPESESSMYGTFVPGSESPWERKFMLPPGAGGHAMAYLAYRLIRLCIRHRQTDRLGSTPTGSQKPSRLALAWLLIPIFWKLIFYDSCCCCFLWKHFMWKIVWVLCFYDRFCDRNKQTTTVISCYLLFLLR